MNLVILGPQGCGKGTQAELLEQKYGLLRIETGKILRQIANSDHPLAKQIRETMLSGKLVSDEILEMVLTEKMSSRKTGFIFDGTPRDLIQYHLIQRILQNMQSRLDMVIVITISEEESIRRLSSRRTCENCNEIFNIVTKPPKTSDVCDECGGKLVFREDDTPESIKRRLAIYHKSTIPVIETAKTEGKYLEIDGEQPIEVIHNQIVSGIEAADING